MASEAAPSQTLANPFPGLRSFDIGDAAIFFGRDREIEEISERLRTTRFLSVLGVSGCGKSSLVKAGLLSRLQRGLLVSHDARWHIAGLRPGHDPLGSLTTALHVLPVPSHFNVRHTLEDGPFGIIETVAASGLRDGDKVLLLVDQFEELFNAPDYHEVNRPPDPAKELVNLLLTATEQREYPIYVVLTMRSEYVGHCSAFPKLAECINTGVYLVPQMTRRQFREAIEEPLRQFGGTITGRLVDSLLNDASALDDQLPLLQHGLARMWVQASAKSPPEKLDLSTYETVGPNLSSCLDRHGSEILASLTPKQVGIAERLFRTITDVSAAGRKVRRPETLDRLSKVVGSAQELEAVLNVFRAPNHSFIHPPLEEQIWPHSRIDLTHESLMRQWSALRRWVEDEGRISAIHRRLRDRACLWQERACDSSFLYRGAELAEALQNRWPVLGGNEREFLNASQARRQREEKVKALQARVVEWSVNNRSRHHLLHGRDLDQAQELVRDAGVDIDELDRQFVERSLRRVAEERRRRVAWIAFTILLLVDVIVAVLQLHRRANVVAQQQEMNRQKVLAAEQKARQEAALRETETSWDEVANRPLRSAQSQEQARMAGAWLANVAPDPNRSSITLSYFRNLENPAISQVDKLLIRTWQEFGFNPRPIVSEYDRAITNIRCGSEVPLRDLQIVACTLIRAGMPIRAISTFDSGDKQPKVINIGGSSWASAAPLWTIGEVLAATSFGQTKADPLNGRHFSRNRSFKTAIPRN